MTTYIDWPRYSRWTWIVAILLLLALLWLWYTGRGPGTGCCAAPAATAVAPVPALVAATPTKAPGAFGVQYQDGKWVLTGTVPDQATHDSLLASAQAAFGKDNVIDQLTIDANTTASACTAKPDELFKWLKGSGSVGVACTDATTVTLTGTVPSDQVKQSDGDWAQSFFGPSATIVNNLLVLQAAAKAEDVKCGDTIAASVTFATASATIDADGRKLLDAVAKCLAEGNYEVSGHTDNVGSDKVNDPLSQRRADAVRTYLVGKGVDAARLTAKGYGSKRPIASNDTDEGRAQNRRIEFRKQ